MQPDARVAPAVRELLSQGTVGYRRIVSAVTEILGRPLVRTEKALLTQLIHARHDDDADDYHLRGGGECNFLCQYNEDARNVCEGCVITLASVRMQAPRVAVAQSASSTSQSRTIHAY